MGGQGVLLPHLNCHVVTDVLNVDVHDFLPPGIFTSVILSLGFVLVVAGRDLAVRVHLGKSVHIAGKAGLMDVQLEQT